LPRRVQRLAKSRRDAANGCHVNAAFSYTQIERERCLAQHIEPAMRQ
jgi:hypothetical protein